MTHKNSEHYQTTSDSDTLAGVENWLLSRRLNDCRMHGVDVAELITSIHLQTQLCVKTLLTVLGPTFLCSAAHSDLVVTQTLMLWIPQLWICQLVLATCTIPQSHQKT